MEHLTTLDAAFAALDDDRTALHIGSLAVFAGPPLDDREYAALFERKLHLVPRLRQITRAVPFRLARPAWVDAYGFDLRHHLRRVEVGPWGGHAGLEAVMGRFVSEPLNPHRPMWQALLVTGLDANRWAIATKLHHSMVDGVGGLNVLTRLLDDDADAPLPASVPWRAERFPTNAALLRSALRAQGRNTRTAATGVLCTGRRPRQAVRGARSTAASLLALRTGLRRTAPTSLSGTVGRERLYASGQLELAQLDAIRQGLGGTVNDVLLALVTAAQRRLVLRRGERPAPHEVHCLVPVSLRSPGRTDPAGNNLSALIVDLPVEFGDPFARYQALLARVGRAKSAHEADVGARLQIVLDALPPPLVTAAVQVAARVPQHFLTTVVTNVPGPPERLYARGRPLMEHYPYVPIADRLRTGLAVTSYAGRLFYGITADRRSVPEVELLRSAIRDEVETLSRLARFQDPP